MADHAIAKRWLLGLAQLTAVRLSHDEAADFIDAMAPMLAMRFSNETLTPTSLEYVAAHSRFLPTYGEMVERINAWQKSRNPYPIYGGDPGYAGYLTHDPEKRGAQSDEERRWASQTVRSASEQLAILGEQKQDAMRAQIPPRPAALPLSRAQLVEAYRQAGAKGPQPSKPDLRAAAAPIKAETKRGPPVDANA